MISSFALSCPWELPFCSLILWVCLFLMPHVSAIMQYLSFCDCRIHLASQPQGSSMLLQMAGFPPFQKSEYCDVCRCQIFSDGSSINGHLGHFYILGVMDSASVNIGVISYTYCVSVYCLSFLARISVVRQELHFIHCCVLSIQNNTMSRTLVSALASLSLIPKAESHLSGVLGYVHNETPSTTEDIPCFGSSGEWESGCQVYPENSPCT